MAITGSMHVRVAKQREGICLRWQKDWMEFVWGGKKTEGEIPGWGNDGREIAREGICPYCLISRFVTMLSTFKWIKTVLHYKIRQTTPEVSFMYTIVTITFSKIACVNL